MTNCIRCYVSGRVQGVFFRASTQEVAEELGIVGYARNLADRRVEVLACGEVDSLANLKSWLLKGPQFAEVSGVECETVKPNHLPKSFETG